MTVLAIPLFVASALVFDARPVLADAACDQTARQADLTLSQTMTLTGYTSTGDWIISKHVISRNDGPCQVHDVTLVDVLPSGATALSASTNPSGWTCTISGGTITCVSTASVGVPGLTDFYIDFSIPPVTSSTTDVTDAASISTIDATDPNPANNRSWSGIVGADGGTVSTGTPGGCTNPFCQSESIRVPSLGAGASWRAISITEMNGPCTSTGIGRCVRSNSGSTSDYQYHTFVINLDAVTAAGSSYGRIGIVWSEDGGVTFNGVPMCSSRVDIDPCVVSVTKEKIGPNTFVIFVVRTRDDDDWGIDG